MSTKTTTALTTNNMEAKDRLPKSSSMEADDPDSDTLCGCGPCKPSWARIFANPKLFTAHAGILLAVNVMFGAYFGGVLSTIERVFQISSSYSGALTVLDDIVELCLVFIIAYFGHKSHRPRFIAFGGILVGIGSLLSAVPHYVSDPLDPASVIFGSTHFNSSGFNSGSMCIDDVGNISSVITTSVPDDENTQGVDSSCDKVHDGFGPIVWIVIGRIVAGIGLACIYSLIMTYLDDAVEKHKLTSYTACMFMLLVIGPATGFFLSSLTTSMYVDFDRVPANEIPDIPTDDPRWIGAWWLGFLVCGLTYIVLSLPMCLYPKRMPQKMRSEEDDTSAVIGTNALLASDVHIFKKLYREFVGVIKAFKRQITNVPLMFTCLGASVETATLGVLANFLIKTIQTQFVVSSSLAGALFGGIIIPATLASQVISALICRKFKLKTKGCAVYILICNIIVAVVFPGLMFVGCGNLPWAGVNTPYTEPQATLSDNIGLKSPCNADCGCPDEIFRPICGSDGLTYISPCHAGCTSSNAGSLDTASSVVDSFSETNVVYLDCHCILSNFTNDIPAGSAVSGQCTTDCDTTKMLIIFLVLIFLCLMMGGMISNPLVYVNMRVIDEADRSVAVALKQFITNAVGFFPAPVYFGAIINSTCRFWQYSCGKRGSCWIYDIITYRWRVFGSLFVLRIVYIVCSSIVIVSLKPDQGNITEVNLEHVESKENESTPDLSANKI